MAIILEGGCRVSDMHDGEPLSEGSLRIWNQVGHATGAHAISLRVIEIAPGLSPVIINDDCDEILYVLDSEGGEQGGQPVRLNEHSERTAVVGRILIHDRPYDLFSNSGIYIRPHETFAVENSGPDSITLISSRCPEPQAAPEFVTTSNFSPPEHTFKTSPLVRLSDRQPQSTADRWYRVLVDDEVGSTKATQFVGSIPPGRAPDHFHQYEEVLFILKGEGRMWAAATNTPIAAGSCVYLPKGQVHCIENTGAGDLRLLGVFYPAGSPSVRYEAQ
jgi:mannose-6-phosphate isomerase-like protein (cupin superfamily)